VLLPQAVTVSKGCNSGFGGDAGTGKNGVDNISNSLYKIEIQIEEQYSRYIVKVFAGTYMYTCSFSYELQECTCLRKLKKYGVYNTSSI